jgi:hypothetical protein
MDPLSITASVLALAEGAAQVSKLISRLRHFGELPGKIYALKNDVSDLEIVLGHVHYALEDKSLLSDNAGRSLEQMLDRTQGRLTDLTKALQRIADSCTGSKMKAIGKSTIWLREKEVFRSLRDDIGSIKATLNVMLGAANSQHLLQLRSDMSIILELQKVTVQTTTTSPGASQSLTQRLADDRLALTTLLDQKHNDLNDRFDALGKQVLDHQSRYQETSNSDQPLNLNSQTAISTETVRVVASHRLPCRSYCRCACHAKRKLKLTVPGIVEGVFGRIFVGYCGLPLLTQPCDFRGFRDRVKKFEAVYDVPP